MVLRWAFAEAACGSKGIATLGAPSWFRHALMSWPYDRNEPANARVVAR